ncbi:MAG: flagellar hook-length control protein FliK [Fidelibacterota bacterium]|nr:MAG: flagellar hook-length control protein FliK [Candidatus Neomarinimicrobiota bacterium]
MNSGGAPVFQAGHPQLIGVKGKGKGALAASLAGSLFSLIPGAVVQGAQGFGGMLRQLRGHGPGPGIQLTRPPAIAGQSPTGSGDQSLLPVVALNRRKTGAANTPVLRFGEAIQDPHSTEGIKSHIQGVPAEGILSQAVPQAESGNLADASLKASKQPGSKADLPDPGQAPGKRPALHISSVKGEGEVAWKPAEPAGVVANSRSSGVPSAVTAEGKQPEPGDISQSSRLAGVPGDSKPSRSVRPSIDGSIRDRRGGGDNQPVVLASRVKQSSRVSQPNGGDRLGVIRPHPDRQVSADRIEVHSELSHPSFRLNGKAEGLASGIAAQRSHQHPPLPQPEVVETGHQGAGGGAAVGRITNQKRLDSNPSLPERLEGPTVAPQTSGRTSPIGPAVQRPANHRVNPAKVEGQHASAAVRGGGTAGNGSHSAYSLTNQNGSQHPAPDGDGINRDFVKPVSLGIPKNGEHGGNESPAPVINSLPTPAPATVETSASLASLARMTALYYSRFVNGEQRGSVFTFNGGSLGNVQLTFQESDAGTNLHIVVESLEVRHVLQRALPNLGQEWAHQGLDFSSVSVEVGDTGYEGSFSEPENIDGTPAIDSAETEEVSIDAESESARDYGYNTVEFVA